MDQMPDFDPRDHAQVDELWRVLSKLQKSNPKAYHQMQRNMRAQKEKDEQAKSEAQTSTKLFDVLTCQATAGLGGKHSLGGESSNNDFIVKLCSNAKAPYPESDTEPLKLCLAYEGDVPKSASCLVVANDKLLREIYDRKNNRSDKDPFAEDLKKVFLQGLPEFFLAENNLTVKNIKSLLGKAELSSFQKNRDNLGQLKIGESVVLVGGSEKSQNSNTSDLGSLLEQLNKSSDTKTDETENFEKLHKEKTLVEGLEEFLPKKFEAKNAVPKSAFKNLSPTSSSQNDTQLDSDDDQGEDDQEAQSRPTITTTYHPNTKTIKILLPGHNSVETIDCSVEKNCLRIATGPPTSSSFSYKWPKKQLSEAEIALVKFRFKKKSSTLHVTLP